MSNRRRPERRDAHGAPIRSRHEIMVAAGVVVGVLALTVVLLLIFQHRSPSSSDVSPPSSVVSNSTSSTTTPATSASTAATSSTSAGTSSTSTASSSTTGATSTTTP